MRLAMAHIELAKAEFAAILDEVKRFAALVGLAVAFAIFAALLVTIGSSLFVGEWLFGSIGWGVLLFTELSIAIAVVSVLIAFDVPAGPLGRRLIVSTVVGVLVTIVAGLWLFNRLWEAIGKVIAPTLEPATAPLVVGLAVGALLGAIVGLVGGTQFRDRSIGQIIRSAIGWLLIGALAGGAIGAFTAITFSWEVAVALGLAVLLGLWIVLCALVAARGGIDIEAWTLKFTPTQSMESAKETMEWVSELSPRGRKT